MWGNWAWKPDKETTKRINRAERTFSAVKKEKLSEVKGKVKRVRVIDE